MSGGHVAASTLTIPLGAPLAVVFPYIMNSNLYNIIPTGPCQALHLTFQRIATSESLKAGRTGVRCSSDGSHQLVELSDKRVLHGGHHSVVPRMMRPTVFDAPRVGSLRYGYSLALPGSIAREYSASAPRCEPTDPRAILWQLRSGGSLSDGLIAGDDGLHPHAKREPKTEAWYRYFLNIKVRPKPYKPHQELLRQVAGALKTPLPQNLMHKPNTVSRASKNSILERYETVSSSIFTRETEEIRPAREKHLRRILSASGA